MKKVLLSVLLFAVSCTTTPQEQKEYEQSLKQSNINLNGADVSENKEDK